MQTTIPFSGFYESLHDSNIDWALALDLADENGNPYDGLIERFYESARWQHVHEEYAKYFAEAFCEHFKVAATYSKLDSPREYNFETDRIWLDIELDEVKRLLAEVPRELLQKVSTKLFTSRSGFHSFYPPDLDDWPPVEEWDVNHVGTLMEALVLHVEGEGFDEMTLVEDLSGSGHLSNWLYECNPDSERLFRIRDYLVRRDERPQIEAQRAGGLNHG